VEKGREGYDEAKSRYPGYPYAEAPGISGLKPITKPYIYNIVENTIYCRLRGKDHKVYKGVVTVPKQIEDPSTYNTLNLRASVYMRIDGHYQQKLIVLCNKHHVYPGNWFWYNEKKYMTLLANSADFSNEWDFFLYIYTGEENGVPELQRLKFGHTNTVSRLYPHVTLHNGKMYLS
jgi:hypothetical protein